MAEFLIDWEDDLITGETYSPTWVRVLSVFSLFSGFDHYLPRIGYCLLCPVVADHGDGFIAT